MKKTKINITSKTSKTKTKTLLVKDISELPQDNNHLIKDLSHYYVNNNIFADIITLPSTSTNQSEDFQNILKYNFMNSDVKTFDGKDQFLAYITYMK